jgi:hypothetical protein
MSGEQNILETLKGFAGTLASDYGAGPLDDPVEAVTVILVSVGSHALAGTEHVPDPDHSSVEKCSVASCFLAACSVPLISWIKEQGHEVDPVSLMHHVGSRVFSLFPDQDRRGIVDAGVALFREMANAARENKRMEEWLTSVHNVTERYVRTEGRSDCVELIAPLYLVLLMAARQMKG